MILQPAVISLLLVRLLVFAMMLGTVIAATPIVRKWDIRSGSEGQLVLERRTYLVSMMLSYVLVFEIGSFFLFVYAADVLHPFFTGAMCAAGTLNANRFGYPALLLKAAGTISAGVWLIVNAVDNRVHDYPLVRAKYVLLLFLAPLAFAEAFIEVAFFAGLKGDVITSCCGSLFGDGSRGVAAQMAALPAKTALPAFFAATGLTFTTGLGYLATKKGVMLFSLAGTLNFLMSAAALVSFISPYFYELPAHHCPFCILQRAYRYVGYPLYGSLFSGEIFSLGAGLLATLRKSASLSKILPRFQRRLVVAALASYGLFGAISIWQTVFSRLTLL